jgi:hypothetical protein
MDTRWEDYVLHALWTGVWLATEKASLSIVWTLCVLSLFWQSMFVSFFLSFFIYSRPSFLDIFHLRFKREGRVFRQTRQGM